VKLLGHIGARGNRDMVVVGEKLVCLET